MKQSVSDRFILSLNGLPQDEAIRAVRSFGSEVYAVQISHLWDLAGFQIIKRLLDAGAERVWVDSKLLDYPDNALARAQVMADAGAHIISAHALGGLEMIAAVVESGVPQVYVETVPVSLSIERVSLLYSESCLRMSADLARESAWVGALGIVFPAGEEAITRAAPELKGFDFIATQGRYDGLFATRQPQTNVEVAKSLHLGATKVILSARELVAGQRPMQAFRALLKMGVNNK